MQKFLFFLVATMITTASAYAADGHFTIPADAKPSTGIPTSTDDGIHPMGGNTPPSDCANKPALEAWFKDWRQRARQEYADKVAKSIPVLGLPSPVQGVSCIRSPQAFDARYEPNGDFFVLTCLAQSKGKLTHLFKLDLIAQPDPNCLGDAKIQEWINSTACLMPNGGRRFVEGILKPCAKGASPPQFSGGAVAFDIDIDFFNRLLNDRPSIQNIVDEDRRVKGAARSGGSGSGGTPDCNNPLGCVAPGPSGSAE